MFSLVFQTLFPLRFHRVDENTRPLPFQHMPVPTTLVSPCLAVSIFRGRSLLVSFEFALPLRQKHQQVHAMRRSDCSTIRRCGASSGLGTLCFCLWRRPWTPCNHLKTLMVMTIVFAKCHEMRSGARWAGRIEESSHEGWSSSGPWFRDYRAWLTASHGETITAPRV